MAGGEDLVNQRQHLAALELDKFDKQFARGNIVETNYWSTAPNLSDAYLGARNATIETTSAKDISELSFGVNFHDKIGRVNYSAEAVIPPNLKFRVVNSDGRGNLILKEIK